MLVDANQCYTRHLALQVGRELEKLRVLFFEEPLPTDDVDGHAFLADKLDVRIATGENMYTRWDFMPFFQRQARSTSCRPTPPAAAASARRSKIADLAGALPPATPSRTRSPTR